MLWFWDQYLPNAEPHVYASPLLASSLKGLPPALIQIAGMDPLRDEAFAYYEALKEAGVPVTVKAYGGLPHAFYVLVHLDQSAQYHRAVVDWIRQIQENR